MARWGLATKGTNVHQLDGLDRQIVAALVRNGRAPWRLIADVLGQQERTVARRGNRLLESGAVRTNSFINPPTVSARSAFLMRVTAEPRHVRTVGAWLREQPESSWVSALSGNSQVVAEFFVAPDELGGLLYGRLAEVPGVQSFEMTPVFTYYRTPTGWTPEILAPEQYAALHPDEDGRLASIRNGMDFEPLDETNTILAEALHQNGRATLDELAAIAEVSKATVSRRLETLTSSGVLFIRAVVDPATLGFPVEALVTLTCRGQGHDALGEHLAGLHTVRWVAATDEHLLAQVAVASIDDLSHVLADLRRRDDVITVQSSIYAEIFKRSTVPYLDGNPVDPAAGT